MLLMEFVKNADLSRLSTLRVKAFAEFFASPKSIDELMEIFREIKSKKLSLNILGAGSNTLLSSRAIPGVLISTNSLDFINKLEDNCFEVGCGMRMPRFCALMTKENLSGAEFMEGIPGSIGGGIVMNAGAHGSEISKILVGAKVVNLETLEIETWSKEDLNFSYRHSAIDPHKYFLVSGIFQLTPDTKEAIRERVTANNSARTTHQPIKAWTCGCTFKNPQPGVSAGLLIDQLGLKGLQVGDFVISDLHGNFFENHGEGSSMDFCKLMKIVQQKALEQKGLILKPEVQTMGEFTDDEMKIWR
jgi:UDP-N-acetylmuramate dehydrogenase